MKFLKYIVAAMFWCVALLPSFADGEVASAEFSFTLPSYTRITPVTSPVLVANITDRTGNLYAPLFTKFKVVTNSADPKTLYLKANVVTDAGVEEAMFQQGGQVYIAFANLARIPKSSSLYNCKLGGAPNESPGVVAYPITSIQGANKYTYVSNKNKYEMEVNGGISYVTVNVGQNVLKSSFAGNDPRGFYQAILSLTETDI